MLTHEITEIIVLENLVLYNIYTHHRVCGSLVKLCGLCICPAQDISSKTLSLPTEDPDTHLGRRREEGKGGERREGGRGERREGRREMERGSKDRQQR